MLIAWSGCIVSKIIESIASVDRLRWHLVSTSYRAQLKLINGSLRLRVVEMLMISSSSGRDDEQIDE